MALIVLSDGLDAGGMRRLERTTEEARVSSATVYAIKIEDLRALLTRGLSKLASETGGRQFRPSGDNFAGIFRRIETDLRTCVVSPLQAGFAAGCRERRKAARNPSARTWLDAPSDERRQFGRR